MRKADDSSYLLAAGAAIAAAITISTLAANSDARAAQSSSAYDPKTAGADAAAISQEVFDTVFREGKGGFVAAEFSYALGPDAQGSEACPRGLTGGIEAMIQRYAQTPQGARADGEADFVYQRRLSAAVGTAADGRNICMNPDAAGPDPTWQMVSDRVRVDGIDLDGGRTSKGRTCAHKEFDDGQGRGGIDNQFYRVVGCLSGFQSNAQGNQFQTEMLTGSWGILMTVAGVDDLRNDPDVEVGFAANADPIQLSSKRKPLAFGSYAMKQDRKYRSVTRGRIVNGVLTTDPVDVRFVYVVNSMQNDRVLRDARVRMTFTTDGGLEGIIGGYSPIEEMYDLQFGSRSGRTAKGDLAPERLRIGTSEGRSRALGYSCQGAYHALRQAADGHRDPATGQCTSISTQYRIKLVPAFVFDTQSEGANASLVSK